MIENASYNNDGSIKAGPIEGQIWPSISEGSRFWPQIQAWVDAGNIIEPYVATEPPVVVPAEISDRQFFQQLAVMGLITEGEAIAAVATGTLPAALAAFVDQLPTEQQFAARMALQGATTFLRTNPLVETFGRMQGMTSTQIDDLWIAAAKL